MPRGNPRRNLLSANLAQCVSGVLATARLPATRRRHDDTVSRGVSDLPRCRITLVRLCFLGSLVGDWSCKTGRLPWVLSMHRRAANCVLSTLAVDLILPSDAGIMKGSREGTQAPCLGDQGQGTFVSGAKAGGGPPASIASIALRNFSILPAIFLLATLNSAFSVSNERLLQGIGTQSGSTGALRGDEQLVGEDCCSNFKNISRNLACSLCSLRATALNSAFS